MKIGEGTHTYRWIEDWTTIPNTPTGRENGRTHGVVVTRSGQIMVFHQASPAVLTFDQEGRLKHSWGERLLGAHGMTLVRENGTEYLWLTDEHTGEVAKMTLDGKPVMILNKPEHPVYREGKYSPTWVAVCGEQNGGNGDVWVADGYGTSYVHRFDKNGNYRASINGEEGKAGRFNCPHGIWIGARKNDMELYIADRGNNRFQVYDGDGKFKRSFGSDFLTSPCVCASNQQYLFVPELFARIAVLDVEDRLVCYLGRNEPVCQLPNWPNLPKSLIKPGKFNSPHSLAVDASGNLFVVEWIVGGRITKLEKL